MEHFWQTIEGYFTFPDFYEWVANWLDCLVTNEQEAHIYRSHNIVEVGVYTGQSAAFLGVELFNRHCGLSVKFDLVDSMHEQHRSRQNLERLPGFNFISGQSHEVADLYDHRSLDMVFIDADHSYAAVSRDIDAWLPKVRKGGIIAGHDYKVWPGFGVIEAVTERFDRVEIWRGSKGMGDEQMKPHYWPVWCYRVP